MLQLLNSRPPRHPNKAQLLSRRNFFELGASACFGTFLSTMSFAGVSTAKQTEKGHQRLSIDKPQQWEKLGYGMFLHFSMNTYDGDEFSKGDKPASFYNPTKLDVDQWISVARDAGMKYAVL